MAMTPTKGALSEASLKHGGWAWRPQLQEWHKLVHLEQGRGKQRKKVTATLLRRDADRRIKTSLSGLDLKEFNTRNGFTYGEYKS